MVESEKMYRIAYTVGNQSEHRTEYLGDLLTLQEAQKQAAAMNKAEERAKPKGGLGSSSTPLRSTLYFYEKDPIAVLQSVITEAGGQLPNDLATMYPSESGKIELHFENEFLSRVRTRQGQYLWDASIANPEHDSFLRLLQKQFHIEVLREKLDGHSQAGRIAACLGPILAITLISSTTVAPDDRWHILDVERDSIKACAELHRTCGRLSGELQDSIREAEEISTTAYNEARHIADTTTIELVNKLRSKQLDQDAEALATLTTKITTADPQTSDDWLDRRVQHADVIGQLENLIFPLFPHQRTAITRFDTAIAGDDQYTLMPRTGKTLS